MRIALIVVVIVALAFEALSPTTARTEEVPAEYRLAIVKGLDWLVLNQHKDGHWEAISGEYPVAMTALSGMALLMEGSTIREGKYHDPIRRAVDWLMQRSQPNGLIGNPDNSVEAVRYMYGHGFAMLFLSSVVGEEENAERRRKLVDILERAVRFSRNAQSSRGGWHYLSAKESNNKDEGSVTITQLQGLRAARNAGIAVPVDAIQDAIQYLRAATNNEGGIRYSVCEGNGGEGRAALTAAAIACGFNAGEYNSPLIKQWFRFCKTHLQCSFFGGNQRVGVNLRVGHDEYTYYYYAQAVYLLGEDGWTKIFPDDKGEKLRWSTFRKESFDALVRSQAADGSWGSSGINDNIVGPVFATAVYLCILQLDKAVLPIYQR